MGRKQVLLISGSIRAGSTNNVIIDHIVKHLGQYFDFSVYKDISLLPHFNPDLDHDNPPINVARLRDQIVQADAVIFCTPEYVFSLPAVLKNMLEWTVSTTIFKDKPVGLIVASTAGQDALTSLERIVETLGARLLPETRIIVKGMKSKINAAGEIVDVATSQQIANVIQSLHASWATV